MLIVFLLFLDAAYPLLPQLLTPYLASRSGGNLNAQQKKYNKIHSTTRMKIENTFSLLVSRWRFLYRHLYLNDVHRAARAISTCCVLHNMCIDNGETMEADLQLEDMLSNFQQSDNHDGAEFVLEDSNGLPDEAFDLNTERGIAAYMRDLKRRGQVRRSEVELSL